ncbi:MAG: response regulator [Desulfobacteraceae bacterium]|nr:MAG: response regulator [Desulfobacteraceae bacterium]
MYRIAIVSLKFSSFSVFSQALQAGGRISVEWIGSGEEALELVKRAAPDLMILDEKEGEPPDFALVRKIMQQNAMVNVVMIGRMPEKEFHEAAEGLGVLMQLSPQAGSAEAEALLTRLASIGALQS